MHNERFTVRVEASGFGTAYVVRDAEHTHKVEELVYFDQDKAQRRADELNAAHRQLSINL